MSRIEIKYLLNWQSAKVFEAAIFPYVRLDPACDNLGSYTVQSLYFDSNDLYCFWEKVDGERFRRKFRIRWYPSLKDQVFLEIKAKDNLAMEKRRILCDARMIESVQAGRFRPRDLDSPVADEIFQLINTYCLKPMRVISYARRAFHGCIDPGVRITFDSALKHARPSYFREKSSLLGNFFLSPSEIILEIKYSYYLPLWVSDHLCKINAVPFPLSKYCSAVNHWRFANQIF